MTNDALLNALSQLVSEGRNPETMDIDLLSSEQILVRMNQQDSLVPLAVEKVIPEIAQAVDAITKAFKQGGRLLYVGAGTSGRLGVLDASECPPTFGTAPEMVVGIIAGGKDAMFRAKEGAEDDPVLGAQDLKGIALTDKDVVVGIAASGRTPYVIGALEYTNEIGATSVALSCNPASDIANVANIAISPVVGPEALTGSTRLKSGTAQKLVLNMLTTASMIRLGKSYQNLMVDVKATNAKLVARATRIVMQATDCNKETATTALKQTDYDVKLSILMILTGLDKVSAEKQLTKQDGFLRKAVDSENSAS
ncbi:N-acetylmuramic acid 6-phosphate etherase [Vibrio maritimus]|uniref:N-acetylmuramic acid 6-phosphate etherase n=1 Tax=Vibrio maritimus TaxID=990268 RepID=A0A090TFF8_9VIBR|nr:N-acetylmuramic acid 6-phosphate etherase [Vibrio maritimus]